MDLSPFLLSSKMEPRFKISDCGGHRLCLFTLELGHYSLFLYLLFLTLQVFRLLIEQRLPGLLIEVEHSLCIDFRKADQLETKIFLEGIKLSEEKKCMLFSTLIVVYH